MSSAESGRSLLVALDGGALAPEVLERAVRLGRARDVELNAIHVMNPIDLSRAPGLTEITRFDRLIEAAESELERQARPWRRVGARIRTRVLLHGDPARAIVEEAARTGAGMVVVGTRSRPWWSHLLLGSVAEEVVRRCPCPVMVVRAGEESPLRLAS